jgi:hypothetical protein
MKGPQFINPVARGIWAARNVSLEYGRILGHI